MNVLLYNWEQFDAAEKYGGGVTVYLNNLVRELVRGSDCHVTFLSAGREYNPFRIKPYIVETKNVHSPNCKSYKVVNSPILAASREMSAAPCIYTQDEECLTILSQFIRTHGPFGVIHFHNFEGMSVNVLKIKERFPEVRLIFSVHNYASVCPIAQYFQESAGKSCDDFNSGIECTHCVKSSPDAILRQNCLVWLYRKFSFGRCWPLKPLIRALSCMCLFNPLYWRLKRYSASCPQEFVRYRDNYIAMLNRYADVVLAVSERTRQIMIRHGMLPQKTFTSYIGTRVAETQVGHSIAHTGDCFTIAYMGYARADKGFFFLLNALAGLSSDIKSKMRIIFAVRGLIKDEIKRQLPGFADISIYDGYSHEQLDEILSTVNLGVVPVIWEDNLPQVAIEMVAHGVPILCSSMGGASELCTDRRFCFQGGSVDDCREKLSAFVMDPDSVTRYWGSSRRLVTMQEHVKELRKYYE